MTARASTLSLMDVLLPRATLVQNILLIFSGSLLVALCAQISFYLPFSPVPVTGQTFALLLVGATFGARRAAAALLLYLAQGAIGLPVFAPGGLPGLARFAGPTAGYLLAYPLAAFLLGWLTERFPRRAWLLAVLAAEAVIFAGGVSWLKVWAQLTWPQAAAQGLLPFLPGDLLKVVLVGACLPASWWALEKRRPTRER